MVCICLCVYMLDKVDKCCPCPLCLQPPAQHHCMPVTSFSVCVYMKEHVGAQPDIVHFLQETMPKTALVSVRRTAGCFKAKVTPPRKTMTHQKSEFAGALFSIGLLRAVPWASIERCATQDFNTGEATLCSGPDCLSTFDGCSCAVVHMMWAILTRHIDGKKRKPRD